MSVIGDADIPIPRLEEGQRLDRYEFARRYETMPEVKKAELIDGVVHMPRRVSVLRHGAQCADLITWLVGFWDQERRWSAGAHSSVRFDLWNDVQPDVVVILRPEYGGQVDMVNGFIHGPPKLVAEVADDSIGIDLGAKYDLYERCGVREYIVWRVDDRVIDWFVLRRGTFEPLVPGEDGILRSEVFPGLWLDGPALVRDDHFRVQDISQQGLASPEHAAFVARLEQHRLGGLS